MNPKLPWSGEAAADACASSDMCQIGGYLRFQNGDIRWFSEQWSYDDFHQRDIPVSKEMQRDISIYETLAQIGILYSLCHLLPAQLFALTLTSNSDNTAAEAGSNSMFTTKTPFCFFLECLCLLCASVHAQLDVSHIPGYANEFADQLSRMNLKEPFPAHIHASDRIRLLLPQLWHPPRPIQVCPAGASVQWPIP